MDHHPPLSTLEDYPPLDKTRTSHPVLLRIIIHKEYSHHSLSTPGDYHSIEKIITSYSVTWGIITP